MLNVFFTVDVEIWCGSWKNLDENFPQAFQRYVYGHTPSGEYGLRHKLKTLREHGLLGVFFIEPLFAARFGIAPLAEIVGLVREHGHEVQLHLHPEWVDEAREPLLAQVNRKKQFLRDFSLTEQTALIAAGLKLIEKANGGNPNAFRAGSFGANEDTLRALAANRLLFDSSYNASMLGLGSSFMPGQTLIEPIECDGVHEYPMTVFNDGTGILRHVQLGACSYQEMQGLLWQALESKRKSFMMLSHNFELLNIAKNRPDPIVTKRFYNLCRFLDQNRDCFRMSGFHGLAPASVHPQPGPLTSPVWKTGHRMLQQLMRHLYG